MVQQSPSAGAEIRVRGKSLDVRVCVDLRGTIGAFILDIFNPLH